MSENEFYDIIEQVFSRLKNKPEYSKLCQQINDYENGKTLKKQEVVKAINELEIELKISASEKLLYQDYFFNEIQIRFMIGYSYGMIDSGYRVFKGISNNSMPTFTYRRIAEGNKTQENDNIKTFPIITDINEFKSTLKMILNINDDFLKLLETQLSKN